MKMFAFGRLKEFLKNQITQERVFFFTTRKKNHNKIVQRSLGSFVFSLYYLPARSIRPQTSSCPVYLLPHIVFIKRKRLSWLNSKFRQSDSAQSVVNTRRMNEKTFCRPHSVKTFSLRHASKSAKRYCAVWALREQFTKWNKITNEIKFCCWLPQTHI
jgi:hypothetical protein